ncbi:MULTISPECIES: MarR family transcriptional regulator [unclassified Streptomyces]|uniref:MarR family transcriptional regulator n=1 Tax=unclassified Streptomyces TaxID=2593676 RepID=UPI0036FFD508
MTSTDTTATTADTAATTAAPADSRALGLAHYAARGLLEHVLARHGVTFVQQLALRTAVTAGEPLTADELVARVRASLKASPAEVRAALDALRAKELLLADGPRLLPADAGRALLATVTAEITPLSARVWDGIPADDLAAAGRVLALVRERADRELAALAEAAPGS